MKRIARWFLMIGLLGCGACRPTAFVVKSGKPQAEIIIAETPARKTRLAARELQEYIRKITGAELVITNVPGADVPVKIYVGKSKFTDALKLSTDDLAHGAFRMASGDNWLALLGPDQDFVPREPYAHGPRGPVWNKDKHRASKDWDAANPGEYYGFPYYRLGLAYNQELDVWAQDDGGTLNAVYAFLRGLGVRWYFSGDLGEVVPKKDSLALPEMNKTVTPDFPMRQFGYWSNDRDNTLWNLRLGVNDGHEMMGLTQNCHGSKWVYMRDEVKQAHPDWYSLQNGKRLTDHSYSGAPCFSSEGLFNQHLNFARMMFDVRDEPMLSLDACDGYGSCMCQCALCKGRDTPERGGEGRMSDYVWGYVNRVAGELYKTHPDRMVSGLSYSSYKLPPEAIDQLSPNLALVLCQGRSGFYDTELRDANRTLIRAWLEKLPSKQLYIYDYYLHNRPRSQEGVPVYFLRLIADNLRFLKGISQGDMIEVYRHPAGGKFTWEALGVMHLNIYVTARLWWDADQDLDALLDEFYTLYYGPAAAPMKAFVEFSETNWPLMSKHAEPIDKALKLLASARQAAGDGIYGQRVDVLVEYCKPLEQLGARLSKKRENVPQARILPFSMKDEPLDGTLDNEACWPKKIRTYRLHETHTGRPTGARNRQPGTSFQVFYGLDDALYFGIRCADPDMATLNITATQNGDTNIWAGDYVELLIETQVHSYYRIAVSPSGALVDADMRDGAPGNLAWSSGAQAGVQRGTNGWTAEIRVPWAGDMARDMNPLQGIAGRKPSLVYPWCVNVCRQRVREGTVERAAWSPTGSDRFDDVMKFGEMYIK